MALLIADRLDENRSESFAIMFCDFSAFANETVEETLTALLRTSDSILHYNHYFFVVMPYTDSFGAKIVARNIEASFARPVPSIAICYPSGGETPGELLESLHAEAKKTLGIDLDCLYTALDKKP